MTRNSLIFKNLIYENFENLVEISANLNQICTL